MNLSNRTYIHLWVHCLRPWGIILGLFDWVLVEGFTKDPLDAGQVSGGFYGNEGFYGNKG
jgi:hypothetical protein